MTVTARWWRFNLVGAVGCAVQLALLALLTRFTPLPLVVCVAIAVLTTVSHNFLWHVHYTWPLPSTARHTSSLAGRWLAFNLSNGAVSLACNVLVTPMLSTSTGLPVTLANLAAIVTASIANFLIGDRLVFRPWPATRRR